MPTATSPTLHRTGFIILPAWWQEPKYRVLGKRCAWVWLIMRDQLRLRKGESWHGKSFTISQHVLAKKMGISKPTLITVTEILHRAGLVTVTNRQVSNENSIYTLFDPDRLPGKEI
jgi:hypothetical protein